MTFEKDFKDPVKLKNGDIMVSTRYSKIEASYKISQILGFEIGPNKLIECKVRFGIVPSNDIRDFNGPRWHSSSEFGQNEKGVKIVWLYSKIGR